MPADDGKPMDGDAAEAPRHAPPFAPIRAILRYESIVNQIMDLVRSGRLRKGDKFPTERALAETWQVSRPVLREAFRVLEAQGIVESRHGAGRYLRSEQILDLADLRRDQLKGKRQALLQIWELRALLEVRAAELAAETATDAQVSAIFRPLDLIDALPAEDSRQTDMNMEIHMAIAEASNNSYLATAIKQALEVYRNLNFKEDVPLDAWKDLQDEHRPVAEAIKARKPARARAEMAKHFDDLRRALERWAGPEELHGNP